MKYRVTARATFEVAKLIEADSEEQALQKAKIDESGVMF